MSSVTVNKDATVNLTSEEINILKAAYKITRGIARELWEEDAEDNDIYLYAESAYNGIESLLEEGSVINKNQLWQDFRAGKL